MKLRIHFLLLAALTAASCGSEQESLTIVAIDVSKSTSIKLPDSTETLHDRLVNYAYLCGVHMTSKRQSLLVYKFGFDTTEVFSEFPKDKDAYGLQMQRELSIDERPGTNYPVMLESVAKAVKASTRETIYVRIGGDGLDDYTYDKDLQRRFQAAAQSIAADPRVKSVTVWGIHSAGRGELRKVLSVLGNRLVLQSYLENPFR